MWCYAKYKTFTKESEQIKLNILYEPVNVTLIQQEEPVIEGGSVSLECAANSNPQPHTYIWLRTQMGQINSTERKRLFSNITRDTSLSCIAYNDIGTRQSEWLDLDVQYAPVILPESSCFLTGKHLKCVCMAEASPSPSINWTIDGNDSLPSSFSFVATNKKNVVSGELSFAAQKPSNIFCTATNSLGSNTKWLSIERSSMYIWLSALMIPGIGLLLGIAMLICRKKSRNRPQTHFMCNTDMALREQSLPGIAEQEERYGNFQRFQDEDILSPCRPDRSCDDNRLSAVYDNEFVEDMRIKTRAQQQQNNKKAY
ncbi:hypothetical protein PBY51_017426 [Eleginops maclovinus]|uniref:Ig-like domain-containing protein n=1 Tax=Eleginops maclovinus TaxID=56733 RepID=A0AAN7XIZ2_ELEMC|nr:hypothetical protein PBY51_017426 [Eleginops maclovinus]